MENIKWLSSQEALEEFSTYCEEQINELMPHRAGRNSEEKQHRKKLRELYILANFCLLQPSFRERKVASYPDEYSDIDGLIEPNIEFQIVEAVSGERIKELKEETEFREKIGINPDDYIEPILRSLANKSKYGDTHKLSLIIYFNSCDWPPTSEERNIVLQKLKAKELPEFLSISVLWRESSFDPVASGYRLDYIRGCDSDILNLKRNNLY